VADTPIDQFQAFTSVQMRNAAMGDTVNLLPNPADASTGTPYKDIRPGDVFRTASGFRGMKRACGLCVSHADGGDVMLDGDCECWRIVIGGWIK
jgi:hypothetical protein